MYISMAVRSISLKYRGERASGLYAFSMGSVVLLGSGGIKGLAVSGSAIVQ
jgi:hypothetical protein